MNKVIDKKEKATRDEQQPKQTTITDSIAQIEREKKEIRKFRTNDKDRKIVCVENTKIILDMLAIKIYYDVIKKRSYVVSKNEKYNGEIIDYTAIGIMEYASKQNYFISKNTMIDHLMYLARDNPKNRVLDFFKAAGKKWDGVSRIEDVYNTLNSDMDRKLGLAYLTKWCIQAVRLAANTDGKMNQEFVLVFQGEQGSGKTTWLKQLCCNMLADYFKEGLELKPDNKDCVLECISHFIVELGELDGTMKHEQAQLKAFITRSIDEVRKPYERLSERMPRQTILCATVNEEEFLKDKTGNRRYAIIKTGTQIDRLTHIDLEQFWGEIYNLAMQGEPHLLDEQEREQQKIENSNFEMMTDVEVRIETGFQWGADEKHWRKINTAAICETLGLPTKSKNVSQTLKKKGCKSWRANDGRGWIVPPFTQDRTH